MSLILPASSKCRNTSCWAICKTAWSTNLGLEVKNIFHSKANSSVLRDSYWNGFQANKPHIADLSQVIATPAIQKQFLQLYAVISLHQAALSSRENCQPQQLGSHKALLSRTSLSIHQIVLSTSIFGQGVGVSPKLDYTPPADLQRRTLRQDNLPRGVLLQSVRAAISARFAARLSRCRSSVGVQ